MGREIIVPKFLMSHCREKLLVRFAKLLNVEVGDSFTISDSNSREYKLKVADITEMYTGHYLFMNDSYYEKSFSKEYEPNANLIILVRL